MRQTDTEIIEIDKQIQQEIIFGIIADPNSIDPATGEPLPQDDSSQTLGDVPVEPEIDASSVEVSEI